HSNQPYDKFSAHLIHLVKLIIGCSPDFGAHPMESHIPFSLCLLRCRVLENDERRDMQTWNKKDDKK
ncbi:MAG: hypothetical protein KAT23_08270, partial [Anaerolineales bacterium]|nr:hypothetical protein [Anaerolineales bacterium]